MLGLSIRTALFDCELEIAVRAYLANSVSDLYIRICLEEILAAKAKVHVCLARVPPLRLEPCAMPVLLSIKKSTICTHVVARFAVKSNSVACLACQSGSHCSTVNCRSLSGTIWPMQFLIFIFIFALEMFWQRRQSAPLHGWGAPLISRTFCNARGAKWQEARGSDFLGAFDSKVLVWQAWVA